MKCEKCEKEIDGSFGSGRFCSRECSNSRCFSEESKKKKSLAILKRTINGERWGCMVQTEEQRKEQAKQTVEFWNNKVLAEDFSSINTSSRRRKRIILEQEGKCNKCGISEWLGQKVTLEVDHINGNNQDNRRENLVAICPNCHSQTPTWRGRGTKGRKYINKKAKNDKELYDSYVKEGNIYRALVSLGMARSGDSYARFRKAISIHG